MVLAFTFYIKLQKRYRQVTSIGCGTLYTHPLNLTQRWLTNNNISTEKTACLPQTRIPSRKEMQFRRLFWYNFGLRLKLLTIDD